ncbi:MAG: DEAD/DEAH box helicase [Planctomycetota bacterium]
MTTFGELGLNPQLLRGIEKLGFEQPMPIQEEVIPFLLENEQDLLGLAQTGTGKTAAFGLPLIQLVDVSRKQPQGLILTPTRELCVQIAGDLKDFARYVPGLEIVAVYGGADMARQIRALKQGAQVIVATPGRMNDLLNRQKKIDLSALRIVVLDEADEMLNMGFKEELDAILERTPELKRTLLFAATMQKGVMEITKNYMHDPREITVGIRNAGAENVDHICYTVRSKDRYLALKRIVDFHPDIYGIIFCRTRVETKEIAEKLIQDGYNADALHGDLSQAQREYVMQKFRFKNLQMLVATDVAARGLDVKDLTHIINFNLPDENETYTHRSGRTGRAGRKGTSIAIVNLKEKFKIRNIESTLMKKFDCLPVPGGKEICEKQLLCLVDKMLKIEVDHKEIDKFLPSIYEKLKWLDREDLIKQFVSLEFNRFIDYYKDAADLNAPKEEKVNKKWERGSRREVRRNAERGFTRFFVNLGYKDGIAPRDLIGLINRCTQSRDIEIGRIDLGKTSSFFEIDRNFASVLSTRCQGIEYNRKPVDVHVSKEGERHSTVPFSFGKRKKRSAPKRATWKKSKGG